ncbi:MAG: hypothetical protein QXL94_05065 [Candidatus Parvarchaeum sp.]
MFHDKCGSLLVRKKANETMEAYCPNCKEFIPSSMLRKSEPVINKANESRPFAIISDESKDNAPIERHCENCGFDRAYEYVMPPMHGDEDELIMYKCAKCGKVYRENTKTS